MSPVAAYKPGKYKETTINHVITHKQETLENRIPIFRLSYILRELLIALHLT
jgi:hypothetical protein